MSPPTSERNELFYKGFIIVAYPLKLADTGYWTHDITIERHTGQGVSMRNFGTTKSFPTEDNAIVHCFELGRMIIDGEIKHCSVMDL